MTGKGYRIRRRRQSHHGATEQAGGWVAPVPASLPLVPQGEAEMLSTPEQVRDWVEHARSLGVVGYDTEFIGEASYFPMLCVVQLATSERVALIDPLGGLPLTPVWELLADEAVVKVVHAGLQDLEPVVRHLRRPPAAVFDTQIAAGFAAMRYPIGLRDLLHAMVGVELGKGLTFTSWDQRPLSPRHLHYAAEDVRYLVALHAALRTRLESMGRLEWAEQEFQSLMAMETYVFDPLVQCERVKSGGMATPRAQAVLVALVAFRDELARERDCPPRSLIKDGVLIDMARKPPMSLDRLQHVADLPRPVKQEAGERLLAVIRAAKAAPVTALPGKVVVKDFARERDAVDALWARVVQRCEAELLSPALVVSRREVTRFHMEAVGEFRGPPPTRPVGETLLRGWRGKVLGDILMQHLASRGTV